MREVPELFWLTATQLLVVLVLSDGADPPVAALVRACA